MLKKNLTKWFSLKTINVGFEVLAISTFAKQLGWGI